MTFAWTGWTYFSDKDWGGGGGGPSGHWKMMDTPIFKMRFLTLE